MESIEGIILRSQKFEDHGQILTLFSKERGVLSLMYKDSSKKEGRSFGPLLKVEALIRPSDKDLLRCFSLSILASWQALRLDYDRIRLAAGFLDLIGRTLPKKAASPFHYTLLDDHLKALSEAKFPYAIASSFFLKILQHEGILAHTLREEGKGFLEESVFSLHETECSRDFCMRLIDVAGLRGLHEGVSLRKGGLEPPRGNLTTTSK